MNFYLIDRICTSIRLGETVGHSITRLGSKPININANNIMPDSYALAIRQFAYELYATSLVSNQRLMLLILKKTTNINNKLHIINVCQITFRGLTGLVDFDQWGHRSSFILDVMTISNDGLQKVIQWDTFYCCFAIMTCHIVHRSRTRSYKLRHKYATVISSLHCR